MARGKFTPSTVPDHIKPLAFGGTDTEDNIQCLCDDCHRIKSAVDGAATQGAANHPDWLRPSAIPITIVCGPPCSGKTTYLSTHARPGDTIVDLDVIAKTIEPSYRHWAGMLTPSLLNRAIRARNAMLGSLERKTTGRAWFIVGAPTKQERDWWKGKLGGEVVLLHPGIDELRRRAIARGTPKAIKGIADWERASRSPWLAPNGIKGAVAIGLDGWPIE